MKTLNNYITESDTEDFKDVLSDMISNKNDFFKCVDALVDIADEMNESEISDELCACTNALRKIR